MSPDGTNWPPPRKVAARYAVAIAVLFIDLILTFWNLNSMSRIWDALGHSALGVSSICSKKLTPVLAR